MALTKIPAELSSTPGISDSSTSTAITIDSSGNVTFNGAVTATAVTQSVGDGSTKIATTAYGIATTKSATSPSPTASSSAAWWPYRSDVVVAVVPSWAVPHLPRHFRRLR